MADLLNLNAESGRNIIGDDSSPSLNLENSSSGECLKLQNAGGTGNQLSTVSCPTTALYLQSASKYVIDVLGSVATVATRFRSSASAGVVLELGHSVIGAPTVPLMVMTNSCASGAFFQFKGFLASIASATSITRGIRVKISGDEEGWIPVYMSATYI